MRQAFRFHYLRSGLSAPWPLQLIILLIAILAGLYYRLNGLGLSPLSVDEYYLSKSVLFVAEHGFPKFAAGEGFYNRGLLQQYLTAGLYLLGFQIEWALRLIPALSSIIALPAIYLIGRRAGGTSVAIAATVLSCLSLWEIEFARFGRMYAPFQALFLWYVYFMLEWLDNKKPTYLLAAYLLSAVGIFVHSGTLFLLVLNFLPLFLDDRKLNLTRFAKLIATPLVVLFLFYLFHKLSYTEPTQRLPTELLDDEKAKTSLNFLLPPMLIAFLNGKSLWLPPFILCTVMSGIVLFQQLASKQRFQLWALLLHLSVLSALFNQVGLALMSFVTGLFLCRTDGACEMTQKDFIKVGVVLLLSALFWTSFGWFNNAWYGMLSNISLEYHGSQVIQLTSLLLNYPETITRFFNPLFEPGPINALLLFFSFGATLCLGIIQPSSINRTLRALMLIVIGGILFVSIINTIQKISRYSFFFYPIFFIVLAYLMRYTVLHTLKPKVANFAFAASLILFMVVTEDFSVNHLRYINSPEIMYRTAYSLARQNHYYPRRDFRSPAEFINQHKQPDDLIISEVTPVDIYLNSKIDYIYLPMEQGRFWTRAVLHGTKDRWTNANVIYRYDTLLEKLTQTDERIWLIVFAKDWEGNPTLRFNDLPVPASHTNEDKTIKVFLLTPEP